jgi:hypothetical protein
MPTCTCPTCGRPCTPVYCAASTPEAPLLLAYTTQQAAERLGLRYARSIRRWVEPWRGGWRLTGREQRGGAK